jgi:O-antigen ligase
LSGVVVRPGDFAAVSALMWVGLWLGINSGPWVLAETPSGPLGWARYVHALLPLLCLAGALLGLLGRHALRAASDPLPGSLRPWFLYGLAGCAACLLSPKPLHAAYWAGAYLAPFLVLKLYLASGDALDRCRRLNQMGWLVAAAFLAALVLVARDALVVRTDEGLTGYGVIGRVGTVGGLPMSRASGVSRFAVVPCILAFVGIWAVRGPARLACAAVASACAALVYLMQSRGTTLGLGAALTFVMVAQGRRARRFGGILLVLFGVALLGEMVPESTADRITRHLLRDPDRQNLYTLGGRTTQWERAWDQVVASPVLGWGPQADRYVVGEHAHNAYLYAALQAGLPGLALFIAGLAWAWRALALSWRDGTAQRLGQRTTLVQTGGLLTFFTVRSVPEASGAMYGVDLMLLLPAMAYLDVLRRESRA